ADKENIEAVKAGLDADRVDLEAAKQSVESKNGELDQKLATTVAKIQDLGEMEKEFMANKDALQKQMKEVQSELDAIYASLEGVDEEFVGGEFTLPVPGYSKITSYYGWRFNNTDFHTGIDFSGPNVLGKKVVAANSGTVTFTNESYVQGRGYGRYMIVDHGGGYTTLYGHLSAITAHEGERVSKGEQIGKVGTTGWSTGPHLHFEVRINGKHTNPINYLRR
ncbi:MAG: peptidoglycan DD-metalloendopeptidase family protein, partial [Angelakisella sp.]